MQPLTGGVSADVYRLQLSDAGDSQTSHPRSLVLRIHGASHSGHPAALEFALLQALQDAQFPVPEVLMVNEGKADSTAPYLLMSFMPGSSRIAPATIGARIRTMARTLDAIHRSTTTGLPRLPERLEPFPEAFDYWPQGADWQPLRGQLEACQIPAYSEPALLLHGDFWPENLLWQGSEISAVLDWEDAALGDPLADVAAAGVELRYLFGKSAMTQFKTAYAEHRAIDPVRLAAWQIYCAAAAQRFMGGWGLPAARVAHMRREALASISEASEALLQRS